MSEGRHAEEEMQEALQANFDAYVREAAAAGLDVKRIVAASARRAGSLFGRLFEGDWTVVASSAGPAGGQCYFFEIAVAKRPRATPGADLRARVGAAPIAHPGLRPPKLSYLQVADLNFLNGFRHARARRRADEMEELVA